MTVPLTKACRNPRLYANKSILAPMVRIGTVPMRLLALHYGADLVYSPEMVDKRMIGSQRLLNKSLGTVDFVKDGSVIFRTHVAEKDRLVFQLGTSDPELALQAALLVQDDVAAIDLNCGCPKKFSIQAGMGAALLKTPTLLTSILEKLVQNCKVPVSAKIRLFLPPKLEDTHDLIKSIIKTGVSALAIHARDPVERSDRDPAHWDLFQELAETVRRVNREVYGDDEEKWATLILNGDVGLVRKEGEEELKRILENSKTTSVMMARAAQWNPSIFKVFRKAEHDFDLSKIHPEYEKFTELFTDKEMTNSMDSLLLASKRYIATSILTNNHFTNTKYALMQQWTYLATHAEAVDYFGADPTKVTRKLAKILVMKLQKAREVRELCEIFDLPYLKVEDECEKFLTERDEDA